MSPVLNQSRAPLLVSPLLPRFVSREPLSTPFASSLICVVGVVDTNSKWTGRGMVPRREVGFPPGTSWTARSLMISSVPTRPLPRERQEALVEGGGYCHESGILLSPSSGYTHTHTSRTFTHPQLFLVTTCYHAHSLTCSLFPLIRIATSSFPVSLPLCQIISYSTHARGVYWPTYSVLSESCLVGDRFDMQPGTGLFLSVRD